MACSLALLPACGGRQASSEPRAILAPEQAAAPTPSTSAEPAAAPASGSTSEGAGGAGGAGGGEAASLQEYAALVSGAVRRHWTIPATIAPSEAATLEASIEITFDEASRVPTGHRVLASSGNAVFDASVERGLAELVAAGEPLPNPPAGLDERGRVRLRLRGRR